MMWVSSTWTRLVGHVTVAGSSESGKMAALVDGALRSRHGEFCSMPG